MKSRRVKRSSSFLATSGSCRAKRSSSFLTSSLLRSSQYRNALTADTVVPFDASQYVEKSPTKPQGFYDAKVGDVNDTLEEVKRQIDFNQVRLADFLADGDRLRSGCLTTSKFRNGLSRAGVQVRKGGRRQPNDKCGNASPMT